MHVQHGLRFWAKILNIGGSKIFLLNEPEREKRISSRRKFVRRSKRGKQQLLLHLFTDMLIKTILLTLVVCGNCLYEDQIGKFDW